MINQDQMTNFLIRLDADKICFEQYIQFCEDMQNQWTAEAGIENHLSPAAFDLHDSRWNEIRETSLDKVTPNSILKAIDMIARSKWVNGATPNLHLHNPNTQGKELS